MTAARYDGYADWYDEFFRRYSSRDGSAGLLAELLGLADPVDPICVDVGCGTGLHFAELAERGHRLVGVDISTDQLRIARARNPAVVRSDAARLPLSDDSVRSVVMTFTHTFSVRSSRRTRCGSSTSSNTTPTSGGGRCIRATVGSCRGTCR